MAGAPPKATVAELAADLVAEQEALDGVVARLSVAEWRTPTPSPRWSVADQVAHLSYFDHTATVAITDPERFGELARELVAAGMEGGDEAIDRVTLGRYREMAAEDLLASWRTGRSALASAAATLSDGDRVAWYGPSMSARSFLTARLMECWAHGQDVCDAVGAEREATDRLRHVAQLGFITRGWSYANRGDAAPEGEVRVELAPPAGGPPWVFGPEIDDADDVVKGPAEDFCLVVTQRRHLDDTSLVCGDLGRDWLERAQAFAGPPTAGPAPRSR